MSNRTTASAIALAMLKERARDGKTILFPSLGIELTAANLKESSVSDNEHAAAIRRAANEVGRLHDSDLSLDIIWHADALAQQLAEAEARCQRKDAYIARIAARLDAVRRALEDAPGDTEERS